MKNNTQSFNKCQVFLDKKTNNEIFVAMQSFGSFPNDLEINGITYQQANKIPLTLAPHDTRIVDNLYYFVYTTKDNSLNATYQFHTLYKQISSNQKSNLILCNRSGITTLFKINSYLEGLSVCLSNQKRNYNIRSIKFFLKTFAIDSLLNWFYDPLDTKNKITFEQFASRLQKLGIVRAREKLCSNLRKEIKKEFGINEGDVDFETAQNDLMDLQLKEGAVFFDASYGMGKTETLKKRAEIIKEQEPLHKIFNITYRVSLSIATSNNFGFDDYQQLIQKGRDFTDTQYCALVINSLPKLVSDGLLPGTYDVFLDEIDFILAQMTSTLIDDRIELFETFVKFIRNARTVYVTQYQISDYAKQFISENCGKSIIYDAKCKDKPKSGYVAEYVDSYEDIVEQISNDVANGKKLFISATMVRHAEEIKTIISKINPNFNTLVIHSENQNDEAQKAFLQDPNNECLKYDVIIASPAIESGVSITTEQFEKNYGVFEIKTGFTGSPESACQMLFRNRTAKEYAFYISNNIAFQSNDLDIIAKQIFESMIRANKEFNKYSFYQADSLTKLTDYGYFVANQERLENLRYQDPLRFAFDYLQYIGFALNIHSKKENEDDGTKKLIKEVREEVKEKAIDNVRQADNIDEKQAQIHSLRKDANTAKSFELRELDKFEVNSLFNTDLDFIDKETSSNFIKLYQSHITVGLANHYLMEAEEKDVQHIDAYNLINNPNMLLDPKSKKPLLKLKRELLLHVYNYITDAPFTLKNVAESVTNFIKDNDICIRDAGKLGLTVNKKTGKVTATAIANFIRGQLHYRLNTVKHDVFGSGRVRVYEVTEESFLFMNKLVDMHRQNTKYNFYQLHVEEGKKLTLTQKFL